MFKPLLICSISFLGLSLVSAGHPEENAEGFVAIFDGSDMEKLEGLPVAPFMDRDKVTKSSAQVGFISFVIQPLFSTVQAVFKPMDVVVKSVEASLSYYKDIAQTGESAS